VLDSAPAPAAAIIAAGAGRARFAVDVDPAAVEVASSVVGQRGPQTRRGATRVDRRDRGESSTASSPTSRRFHSMVPPPMRWWRTASSCFRVPGEMATRPGRCPPGCASRSGRPGPGRSPAGGGTPTGAEGALRRAPAPGARRPRPRRTHHAARVLRCEALIGSTESGAWATIHTPAGRKTVVVGDPLAGEIDPELPGSLPGAVASGEDRMGASQGTEIGVSAFRLVAGARPPTPPPRARRATSASSWRLVQWPLHLPSAALSAIYPPRSPGDRSSHRRIQRRTLAAPGKVWFAVGPLLSEREIRG
jgi:hypothetical protein